MIIPYGLSLDCDDPLPLYREWRRINSRTSRTAVPCGFRGSPVLKTRKIHIPGASFALLVLAVAVSLAEDFVEGNAGGYAHVVGADSPWRWNRKEKIAFLLHEPMQAAPFVSQH